MGGYVSKRTSKKRTSNRKHVPVSEVIQWDWDHEYEKQEENGYEEIEKYASSSSSSSACFDVTDGPPSRCSSSGYVPTNSQAKHDSFYNYNGYRRFPSKSLEQCEIYSDYTPPVGKTSDPLCYIEQMVEAFRPLIEESVKVIEIVSSMVFIENAEFFLNKEKESATDAMSLLLDAIEKSTEPGKWQTFLDALKTAGYQYVVNILTGVTERDNTIPKKLIQIFKPQLIKDMYIPEFIDQLIQRELISDHDKEQIQCEERNRGQIAAAFLILDRVHRRLEDWYPQFVEVLRVCGHPELADQLDIPESTMDCSAAKSKFCDTIVKQPFLSRSEGEKAAGVSQMKSHYVSNSTRLRAPCSTETPCNTDYLSPVFDRGSIRSATVPPPPPRRSDLQGSEETHDQPPVLPQQPSRVAVLKHKNEKLQQRLHELRTEKKLERENRKLQKMIDILEAAEDLSDEETDDDMKTADDDMKTADTRTADHGSASVSQSTIASGNRENISPEILEIIKECISKQLESQLKEPVTDLKKLASFVDAHSQLHSPGRRFPSRSPVPRPHKSASTSGYLMSTSSGYFSSDYEGTDYIPATVLPIRRPDRIEEECTCEASY